MYSVNLAQSAVKSFEQADAPLQRRLDRCFDMLKNDPRGSNNVKRLHGRLSGRWRYRVGITALSIESTKKGKSFIFWRSFIDEKHTSKLLKREFKQ